MITGFGLRGYRSFWGTNIERVGPMSKVHLVIGQNNSGKSNVLRAAQNYLPQLGRGMKAPQGLDIPQGQGVSTTFGISISCDIRTLFEARLADEPAVVESDRPSFMREMDDLLALPAFHPDGQTGHPWFDLAFEDGRQSGGLRVESDQLTHLVDEYAVFWNGLNPREVRSRSGLEAVMSQYPVPPGGVWTKRFRTLIQAIAESIRPPKVTTISAFRQIREVEDQEESDHSGTGLIKRLARLENPGVSRYHDDYGKYIAINQFTQTVLEDPTARLRVPAEQDAIIVESNGRALPLESLGTGVHEVIIMAVAATLLDDQLVCIEEPEVHLHPLMQRRLLRYLREQTSNQYLIATHSAHILDSSIASMSHIQLTAEGSTVDVAVSREELSKVSADLGYRASDIVQANAVVWVEGPSDRIYLRYWISLVDSTLVEGVHYSIMFYGGRLLSHLSASDDEVEEFIALRRLNRNLVVLIDSDKRASRSPINATKRRVRDEFNLGAGGFAWVTAGREIENYVPKDLLHEAIKTVHPGRPPQWDGGPYSEALSMQPKLAGSPNKNDIAKYVVLNWASREPAPVLKSRVRQLVGFLRKVNDMPEREMRGPFVDRS